MKVKITKPILFIIFFFNQCTLSTEDYKKIAGSWKCISWKAVNSDVNQCNEAVKFVFNENKTMEYDLGSTTEASYFVENRTLTVKPEGGITFTVKIIKLTQDSLSFLMNSGGTGEILDLIKIQ